MKCPRINPKLVVYSCYATAFLLSGYGMVLPVLLMPLRSLYGLNFTMLGLLLAVGVLMRLGMHKLVIYSVKIKSFGNVLGTAPVYAAVGMLLLAAAAFPASLELVYLMLVLGAAVLGIAQGLSDALTPFILDSIQPNKPDKALIPGRESPWNDSAWMLSRHHAYCRHTLATYAPFDDQPYMCTLRMWRLAGAIALPVGVSGFLAVRDIFSWPFLMLICAALAVLPAVGFLLTDCPVVQPAPKEKPAKAVGPIRALLLAFCSAMFAGIILPWVSVYAEILYDGLGGKLMGDLVMLPLVALALLLGRSSMHKHGTMVGGCALTAWLFCLIARGTWVGYLLAAFCAAVFWPGNYLIGVISGVGDGALTLGFLGQATGVLTAGMFIDQFARGHSMAGYSYGCSAALMLALGVSVVIGALLLTLDTKGR